MVSGGGHEQCGGAGELVCGGVPGAERRRWSTLRGSRTLRRIVRLCVRVRGLGDHDALLYRFNTLGLVSEKRSARLKAEIDEGASRDARGSLRTRAKAGPASRRSPRTTCLTPRPHLTTTALGAGPQRHRLNRGRCASRRHPCQATRDQRSIHEVERCPTHRASSNALKSRSRSATSDSYASNPP